MTQLSLYPPSSHLAYLGQNVHYYPEVDHAVHAIHEACRGLGTNEKVLIDVLGTKTPEQRSMIVLRYKQLHNKALAKVMKKETSGNFGKLLKMLAKTLQDTEAKILREATRGIGTNEELCIQILSGRTNEDMQMLRNAFYNQTGKDLSVTMSSEIRGDFKKVIMAMLQAPQIPYDPIIHNLERAEKDASKLYKAGQGRLGTNEENFIRILVECPPQYMKLVNDIYFQKHKNSITQAVEKEFSGNAKKALVQMVELTLNPFPEIAKIFELTMKGIGTKETALSTAIVRYQVVLPYVKIAYQQLYGKDLRNRIDGETSGDYKRLLLSIYDSALAQPAASPMPPQQYPPQQYPPQQYPPQQYPPEQYLPQYPPQQYPPQQYPPQQYPPQQYAPQHFPPQQYPAQQYPPQQYSPQQYSPQQYPPQQFPQPGHFPSGQSYY